MFGITLVAKRTHAGQGGSTRSVIRGVHGQLDALREPDGARRMRLQPFRVSERLGSPVLYGRHMGTRFSSDSAGSSSALKLGPRAS